MRNNGLRANLGSACGQAWACRWLWLDHEPWCDHPQMGDSDALWVVRFKGIMDMRPMGFQPVRAPRSRALHGKVIPRRRQDTGKLSLTQKNLKAWGSPEVTVNAHTCRPTCLHSPKIQSFILSLPAKQKERTCIYLFFFYSNSMGVGATIPILQRRKLYSERLSMLAQGTQEWGTRV